jgi:hypothetical protein
VQPALDLVPGPAAIWKAILPSIALTGEPFRLAVVAEDKWGNPTADASQSVELESSHPVHGLPARLEIKKGDGPRVIEHLVAGTECDLEIRLVANGRELARANPLRVVKQAALRRYWGDLHGQSGETIGMGTADAYFRYARDAAFIDMVGHQGNDFQITDTFWKELNLLTAEFDVPGQPDVPISGIRLSDWLHREVHGEQTTNVVSGTVDLGILADNTATFDGGGLGRQVSVYRLPEAEFSHQVTLDHTVVFAGGADLPVYLRVTQADGHQAWSSPIYLIK